MAIGPDKVRLQIVVDREVADKIEEMAALLDMSTSRMGSRLLQEAVKDNEWIIRRIAAPMRRLVDKLSSRPRKAAE